MPVTTLMPLPKQQYLSALGLPLVGGKVYTYAAGSTNPKQTFTDAAGTTPHENPIQLNVRGEPPAPVFWSGNYRVDVRDALGNLVYSVDNYNTDPAGLWGTFTTLLANAGATLIGWIQAGAGAIKRTVADKLKEAPLSVYDFGAKGDGVADDTAAFKAAFAAATSAVYIPAGAYKLTDTISKVTNGAFRIFGDGVGITFVQMFADKDMFSFSNAGGSQPFVVEQMTLQPRANMVAGAALNFRNDTALPSVRVVDVFIGSSSTYEFKYGIKATNCTEAIFDRVVMYGLGTANFIGWEITATMAATVPKWFGCSVYNARYGVHLVNSTKPGIEGVQFYGCDLTAVSTGVFFENTYGTGYFPPQLVWIGGHINATNRNFDINTISQVTITGGLFYNSGPGPMMNINTCSDLHICQNKFFNVGAGTPSGLDIYSSTGPINLGLISQNYFGLNAASICINFAADQPIYNGVISENIRAVGARTFTVARGTKDPSIRLMNNSLDSEDFYDTTALAGTVLSIAGKRSKFFGASGAGTANTMPGGYPGDTVTLKCDGGLTLQHNGSAGGGFLLKGAANFTFTSGSLITLTLANGGYWTEVSRSV